MWTQACRALAFWMACAWLVPAWSQSSPALLPADLFFKPAVITGAKLSPSGRWVALAAAMASGRVGLVVADTLDPTKLQAVANFKDVDVTAFQWVTDERLIFSVDQFDRSLFNIQHLGGLSSIKRDGTELRHLVDTSWGIVYGGASSWRTLPANHRLLHVPSQGNEIIVGESRYRQDERTLVVPKRLNVETGLALGLEIPIPHNTLGWVFDVNGEPRVAITSKDGRVSHLWRDAGGKEWKTLGEFEGLNVPYRPVHVDEKQRLWVVTPTGKAGEDTLRLFDFQRGKPADEAMLSTPGFDALASFETDEKGTTLGLHVHTDAYGAVWFDERLKALQAEADRRFPNQVVKLSCQRCRDPEMTVLVHAWSDRDPGQFWIYRAADRSWLKVGDSRPDVDPRQMATVDFHRFQARDGQEVPVWVTLPVLPKGSPKPAAVVLVHGGPWVRGGHWAWDSMGQFLASRGYAVIEPEFRGSTGYGDKLFRAGWKQWGGAMQDDVADALHWARQQGLVDGGRACIMGASYGGYAALMNPIKHPALYRCAVSWVGVSDPALLFEWSIVSDISLSAIRYGLPRMVGDLQTDAEMLRAASPLHRAAELKVPLLLAYGSDDRRVPLKHGTQMRDALTKAGRPPEWVVYAGEGHGGWTLKTQVDFAQRTERFLSQHLK